MKKTLFLFAIISITLLVCSFYLIDKNDLSGKDSRDIVLQFITYNGYGNNLYIDNVLTGTQPDNDISVTSILNIPYDTTYSTFETGSDTISPIVTVTNIGRIDITSPVTIFFKSLAAKYIDTVSIPSLGSGQTTTAEFPPLIYTTGTGYDFKAYTSYSLDTNRINDTLNQYSIILPGYTRNVLYEEITSDSSPACANNDSFLDDFVNTNIQSVTAIKYHTGLTGTDSFYLANPEQQDARRRYYYVSAVPTTIVDGKLIVSIPYGDSINLYSPYFTRLSKGTPFSLNVIDNRVGGDSIMTTIDIRILSPVPTGNYKLRINAVERLVVDSLKGVFGESNFYDVFRETFPDTNGISISTSVGVYQYQYTYYRDPEWVDSMIYTAAFIQNDNTREVMNCAKGRNIVFRNLVNTSKSNSKKSDLLNVNYDYKNNFQQINFFDTVQTFLNIELFEAFFPPLGWRIFNQDGFITFQQFTGANGPTFGGTKSVIMDFFDYNIPGQSDSMYSKIYSGLLSSDTIRFDYAYAQYNSINIDSLTVKVSTDGGITFPTEIFRRGGLALATAPQTSSFFVPTDNTQWRTITFSLNGIVSAYNNYDIIPSKFSLKQNYPNPFNPKTIINYELPIANYVKLIVYDILGKEIMKLVNVKQNAGSHEISFDGNNLPSGIYFYQLSTESFTDTKRMVLIK